MKMKLEDRVRLNPDLIDEDLMEEVGGETQWMP